MTTNPSEAKNPAIGFLYMAVGNFLGMIVFAIVYFLLKDDTGEPYTIILVLSGVLLVASISSLILFVRFTSKMKEAAAKGGKG